MDLAVRGFSLVPPTGKVLPKGARNQFLRASPSSPRNGTMSSSSPMIVFPPSAWKGNISYSSPPKASSLPPAPPETTAGRRVFCPGNHEVHIQNVDPAAGGAAHPRPPPKRLLVASPIDRGEYAVLLLFAGFCLENSFYTDLIRHIAGHGFIVVAPQLYTLSGPNASDEIKAAAAAAEWLPVGLQLVLPPSVRADFAKLGVAGHSRGGKVAFALQLDLVKKSSGRFSAVIGIDPVDGMGKGKQTTPPVLTHVPQSLATEAAAMVIGSGMGELRNGLFPPSAPAGVNHRDFASECPPPSCHLVAEDYGHLDVLDDVTPGWKGFVANFLCKSGGARAPMRSFVGGAVVAFLRSFLLGDTADLLALKDDPSLSPVNLSIANFLR